MSYNAELAVKPLKGNAEDILILQEREQRLLVGANGRTDHLIIPTVQYCELRDMYEKLVNLLDSHTAPPGEMSIERAVAILNPETRAAALAEYEYYGGFHGREAAKAAYEKACRLAARTLREMLLKSEVEDNV